MRAVRRPRGLSLLAVVAASGGEFKASALGAYERGDRAISVARLERLAALYEVPIEALRRRHPSRYPVVAARAEPAVRGRAQIDLGRLRAAEQPEAATLRRFVSSIQRDRQDFNGRVITVSG